MYLKIASLFQAFVVFFISSMIYAWLLEQILNHVVFKFISSRLFLLLNFDIKFFFPILFCPFFRNDLFMLTPKSGNMKYSKSKLIKGYFVRGSYIRVFLTVSPDTLWNSYSFSTKFIKYICVAVVENNIVIATIEIHLHGLMNFIILTRIFVHTISSYNLLKHFRTRIHV